MVKKKRYWYCEKCGRLQRRYKHKDEEPECCEYYMIPSRTTTRANRISNRRYDKDCKIRNTIINFKEKYYSEVRDSGGRKLRVSKKTKQLWKPIQKCKTRPALIRKAQSWLERLKDDIRNTPENSWAKSINNDGTITRSRGGWSSSPKIILKEKGHNLHGMYRGGVFAGGLFIDLYSDNPIKEMKKTLLHEVLHYIDHCSQTPSNHNDYFFQRLDKLERIFKVI